MSGCIAEIPPIDEKERCVVKMICTASIFVVCLMFGTLARCQNPDLAKDFAEEGLTTDAKLEFIKVLHDPTKKSSYDMAEYYLGYLDFKSKNYELAVTHWNKLLKKYPGSSYAQKAKDQLAIASELLSKNLDLAAADLDIEAIFDNADFLVGQPLKVSVDMSYLPKGDMAIEWLEKIVTNYPTSTYAARALFREALLYYGYQTSSDGGYGFAYAYYGGRNNAQAAVYVKKMEEVFARLQKDYPTSGYLVPIAHLIGQAYWSMAGGKVNPDATKYWQKVLDLTSGDETNSYRQYASWRLKGR